MWRTTKWIRVSRTVTRMLCVRHDLEAMDFEELWILHEELTKILLKRSQPKSGNSKTSCAAQPAGSIWCRLKVGRPRTGTGQPPRRKYPKVVPKYFNPLHPTETWSGRGKQPRWLVAALQLGHTLEEFRISRERRVVRSECRWSRSLAPRNCKMPAVAWLAAKALVRALLALNLPDTNCGGCPQQKL